LALRWWYMVLNRACKAMPITARASHCLDNSVVHVSPSSSGQPPLMAVSQLDLCRVSQVFQLCDFFVCLFQTPSVSCINKRPLYRTVCWYSSPSKGERQIVLLDCRFSFTPERSLYHQILPLTKRLVGCLIIL
jgi:hypothetical protein